MAGLDQNFHNLSPVGRSTYESEPILSGYQHGAWQIVGRKFEDPFDPDEFGSKRSNLDRAAKDCYSYAGRKPTFEPTPRLQKSRRSKRGLGVKE